LRRGAGGLGLALALGLLAAPRATEAQEPAAERESPGAAAPADPLYRKGRWEFGLESAYLFTVVANPLTAIGGDYTKNQLPYRLATQILSARYRVTDAAGPFFLRGSLQVTGSAIYSAFIEGPEPFFAGLAVGLRYDFVQPGARIVPYVEVRGGPGFTDARQPHREYAQQQDFTFTVLMGAGLRYDHSPGVSLSLGVLDQHVSNAYMTRPNYGFDVIGVHLALYLRF
jgi:hypothetical protein